MYFWVLVIVFKFSILKYKNLWYIQQTLSLLILGNIFNKHILCYFKRMLSTI